MYEGMKMFSATRKGIFRASISFASGLVLRFYSREEFDKAVDTVTRIQLEERGNA